jgi:biotin transport system substrate-specific component
MIKKDSRTHRLVLCALFAALLAALSQMAIPIGPVPVNLATFAVFCAGALLGAKYGCLSVLIWMAVGALGVPVFSLARGGFGVLLGPTGGYIIGYAGAALTIGAITEAFNKKAKIHLYAAAMLAGMFVCFTLGTAWFMFSMQKGLTESLMACVVPFLPGDFLKIAAAAVIVRRVSVLSAVRS